MEKTVRLPVKGCILVIRKTEDKEFVLIRKKNPTQDKEEESNNTLKNYMLDKVSLTSVKPTTVLPSTHLELELRGEGVLHGVIPAHGVVLVVVLVLLGPGLVVAGPERDQLPAGKRGWRPGGTAVGGSRGVRPGSEGRASNGRARGFARRDTKCDGRHLGSNRVWCACTSAPSAPRRTFEFIKPVLRIFPIARLPEVFFFVVILGRLTPRDDTDV